MSTLKLFRVAFVSFVVFCASCLTSVVSAEVNVDLPESLLEDRDVERSATELVSPTNRDDEGEKDSDKLKRSEANGVRYASLSVSSRAKEPNFKGLNNKSDNALELDDVQEFLSDSDESEVDATYEEDLAAEASEEIETAEDAATNDFQAIIDECFYALDPYSSLFIEHPATSEWTDGVLALIEEFYQTAESEPERARLVVKAFRSKISQVDALKNRLASFDFRRKTAAQSTDGETEVPRLVSRYTPSQRQALLESFRNALERRAHIWLRAVDYFEAKANDELTLAKEPTSTQLVKIIQRTEEVQKFFGDSSNGRSWRSSFDVDAVLNDARRLLAAYSNDFEPIGDQATFVTEEDSKKASALERARLARFLRDRLNSVAYKIEKTPMTSEQRKIFSTPSLAAWTSLVGSFACDQTEGSAALYEFERYENVGSGRSARSLQQVALRMATSKSSVCREFGRCIESVYDNPNIKTYVSEALINRLLPIRDPEFDVVQETILNNPVAGSRRVDTEASIKLTPDPERLLMTLNVHGRVFASTSSEFMSARLHNQSYATYAGAKLIEWRDSGIVYSPARVNADSAVRLEGVETEIDFVPLVGDVAREVMRSQYESKQEAIRSQTKIRVAQEARERIDKEANERFDAVNARLRDNFFKNMSNLGLSLKTQRSRTTEDWLLASLRFGSDFSLGCQSPEPPTLSGAFADFKFHESAVNSFLAQLDLAGRTLTPRETLDYLADKLNKPRLRDIEIADSKLSFTFADEDPVVVRFFEDRVFLRLTFNELTLGKSTWNDVEVSVSYKPTVSDDGTPTFERDGMIELYGPTNIRAQIPLRAVFTKLFPPKKSFDVDPEILKTDERFAGLGLGLCRVSRGWFAISVVKRERTFDDDLP